jgi:hypothetical protein
MLIRALIYRITTDELTFGPGGWTPERCAAYQPAIDLTLDLGG